VKHFDEMNGYEFERFIYDIFVKLGFRTQFTKASGDGGIDLLASYDGLVFHGKYLVQCKRWKGSVRPTTRQIPM
jgi:restriction system protein